MQKANNFTPIIDQNGGDPWVIQQGGWYYYTKTTGDDITLWRSKALSTVATGEKKIIFQRPDKFERIWAPELHFVNNEWRIYYCINLIGQKHLMYGLKNLASDPFSGEWENSKILGMDQNLAIDGTLLCANHHEYLVWSGAPAFSEDGPQNLYIAELELWNEIVGEKILLSQPEFSWEMRQQAPINEGPEMIIHDDVINLVYSASPSWENGYCLGLLTADVHANLLNKNNWRKESTPIFDASDTIYSPGHNSFVTTADGKENWLIYHAARYNHSGFGRSIRMEPFSFDSNNHVVIGDGQPISSTTLQNLPSGDGLRYRVNAESLSQKGGNLLPDKVAVGGLALKISSEEKISFSLPKSELAGMALFLKNSTGSHENVELTISINGKVDSRTIYSSEYYQPVYFSIDGYDERQEIFLVANGRLLLDRLELF